MFDSRVVATIAHGVPREFDFRNVHASMRVEPEIASIFEIIFSARGAHKDKMKFDAERLSGCFGKMYFTSGIRNFRDA